MAEIGLVRFAQVARQVAEAALPRYRSKYSKHTFTQRTLLAVLCVMRYEDWTYRETEVRLAEHQELRDALGLARVPDHTTLYRCLCRLQESDFDQLLAQTIEQMPPSIRSNAQPTAPPGTTVAVDGTGLTPAAISTFFVNRVRDRGEGFTWRHWVKWVVVADLPRQLILAQMAHPGPCNDEAFLPMLLEQAAHLATIACVLADGEFDSERNHRFIRQDLGAMSVIPAKRGKATWHLHGIRAQMRTDFPRSLYRQRAGVETLFSTTKRKLSARAPGCSPLTQQHQALLLGVTFNLYRLRFPSFLLLCLEDVNKATGLLNRSSGFDSQRGHH